MTDAAALPPADADPHPAPHPGPAPRLSLIIPARNAAPWIDECLTSVADTLARWGAPAEVWVIDDGSTDGTGERAAAWATRLPPGVTLAVHRLDGVGVSQARNQGLALAHGDYLWYVDADDVLLPEAAARALARLDAGGPAHGCDALEIDHLLWYPDAPGDTPARDRPVPASLPAGTTTAVDGAALAALFASGDLYCWRRVVRRAVYARLAPPVFPPGRLYEDASAMPGVLAACTSWHISGELALRYRQRPGSLIGARSLAAARDAASCLQPFAGMLRQRPELAAAVGPFEQQVCQMQAVALGFSVQIDEPGVWALQRELVAHWRASLLRPPLRALADYWRSGRRERALIVGCAWLAPRAVLAWRRLLRRLGL